MCYTNISYTSFVQSGRSVLSLRSPTDPAQWGRRGASTSSFSAYWRPRYVLTSPSCSMYYRYMHHVLRVKMQGIRPLCPAFQSTLAPRGRIIFPGLVLFVTVGPRCYPKSTCQPSRSVVYPDEYTKADAKLTRDQLYKPGQAPTDPTLAWSWGLKWCPTMEKVAAVDSVP